MSRGFNGAPRLDRLRHEQRHGSRTTTATEAGCACSLASGDPIRMRRGQRLGA
jgi:hypothetical protein